MKIFDFSFRDFDDNLWEFKHSIEGLLINHLKCDMGIYLHFKGYQNIINFQVWRKKIQILV